MTIAPVRAQPVTHMGELACHLCGGPVHSDCDPNRNGRLTCPACGPVWMHLDDRYIRIRIAVSLAEASERAAGIVLAVEGGRL